MVDVVSVLALEPVSRSWSTLEHLLGESKVSPSVFEDLRAVSVVSLQVQQVSELHLVESVASQ